MLMLVWNVQSCSSHHIADDGNWETWDQPALPAGVPVALSPWFPTARQGPSGHTNQGFPNHTASCDWKVPHTWLWGCLLQATHAESCAAWEWMLSLTSASTQCLPYFFLCILHTEHSQAALSDATDQNSLSRNRNICRTSFLISLFQLFLF